MVMETTPRALWGRGAGCLSSVRTFLPRTVGQAVKALSELTSRALLGHGCRLFNRGWNLPPEHCWAGCLSGVSSYFISRLEGQNWILFYFYFRTDQMKPGQLLLLRSAFLFLLREIYIVRMSTSEFNYFTHATKRFCISSQLT